MNIATNIRTANDAMIALADALNRLDADTVEAIQKVTEDWMQTAEEAAAWRILTEAILDTVCEQCNT